MNQLNKENIQLLIKLYNSNLFNEVENKTLELINKVPNNIFLNNLLGLALARQNKFKEATNIYKKILKNNPNNSEIHNNYGLVLQKQYKLSLAIKSYENAIKYNSKYAEAYFNLGNVQSLIKNYEKSSENYNKTISIKPNYIKAYINLGTVLNKMGRIEEAVNIFYKALKINPKSFESYFNLGNIYFGQENYKDATSSYNKAIIIKPDYVEAFTNLAYSLNKLGNHKKAISYYKKAIKINPAYADAHYFLGIALLLLSNFNIGFNKYEWRKKSPPLKKFYDIPNLKTKEWDKEDIANKSILIISEQGLGDTIQFFRYADILQKKYKANIIFRTKKKLKHLFVKSNFKIISDQENIPKHDYHIFLMSLPGRLFQKNKIFPKEINYIPINNKIYSSWKGRLSSIGGIKIGINWHGNIKHKHDKPRSISLNLFEELFALKGISFISLQKGYGVEQIDKFKFKNKLKYFHSELEINEEKNAFEDTIGILKNLDLVITVDTAIAHLSATLGVNTWILIHTPFPDWRWSLKKEKTGWYNNVKLIRQTKANEWNSVISDIKKTLIKKFNLM